MVQYFLKKWFEEPLRFVLRDNTEVATVWIGNAEFSPIEILEAFKPVYDQEFNTWLNDVWRPAQLDLRLEILKYSANADRYRDLKSAVTREQVLPLVGSGMSVPSGLPTWANFLKKVARFLQRDESGS